MAQTIAKLSYSHILCRGCGADRVIEQPCSACGARPRTGEANAPVVRRREILRRVERQIREAPEATEEHLSIDGEALTRWLSGFLGDLEEILANPSESSEEALVRRVLNLSVLRRALVKTATLRPTGLDEGLLDAVENLEQLWPIYVRGLTSSSPHDAQNAERECQTLMDKAADKYANAGVARVAANAIADTETVPDLLTRVMEALAIRYPDDDLESLGERGHQACHQLVGRQVSLGSALDYLVVALISDSFLNPELFSRKIRECSFGLRSGEANLREIATLDGALEDLARVRRETSEAVNHFLSAVNGERNSASVMRRVVKVAGELYEVAAPLWAWVRVILGPEAQQHSYRNAIRRDATDNVSSIGRCLPLVASGAPADLRNAAQHGRAVSVDETSGHVTIELRSFEGSFTPDEYLDRVFGLIESILALNWCLSDLLDHSGIDVPIPEADANYIGISIASQASFWLAHFRGYTVARSEVDHGTWYLEVDMPADQVLSTAIVLARAAVPGVNEVVLRTLNASGEAVQIDDSTMEAHEKAFLDADDLERAVLVAELTARLAAPENPPLADSHLESLAATVSVSVVAGNLEHAPLIRRVRALAEAADRFDLVKITNAAIASLRTGDAGTLKADLAPLVAAVDLHRPIKIEALSICISK